MLSIKRNVFELSDCLILSGVYKYHDAEVIHRNSKAIVQRLRRILLKCWIAGPEGTWTFPAQGKEIKVKNIFVTILHLHRRQCSVEDGLKVDSKDTCDMSCDCLGDSFFS